MPRRKMEEVADGIYMEPVPITAGEEVKIKYKGDLSNNNASKIYLHAGFGYEEWQDIQDIPMRKTRDGGWSVRLKIIDDSCFNFCFRDSAMNWDNNKGRNWTYEIHDGSIAGH